MKYKYLLSILAILFPLASHAQVWEGPTALPPNENRPGPVWLQTFSSDVQPGSFYISDSGTFNAVNDGTSIYSAGDISFTENSKAFSINTVGVGRINMGNWGFGGTGFELGVYGNLLMFPHSGGSPVLTMNGTSQLNVFELCLGNPKVCRTTWPSGAGTLGEVDAGTGIIVSNGTGPTATVEFDEVYGDNRYVNVTGDTMTGNLILESPAGLYANANFRLTNGNNQLRSGGLQSPPANSFLEIFGTGNPHDIKFLTQDLFPNSGNNGIQIITDRNVFPGSDVQSVRVRSFEGSEYDRLVELATDEESARMISNTPGTGEQRVSANLGYCPSPGLDCIAVNADAIEYPGKPSIAGSFAHDVGTLAQLGTNEYAVWARFQDEPEPTPNVAAGYFDNQRAFPMITVAKLATLENAIEGQGDIVLNSDGGVRLDADTRPLITRAYSPFTGGKYQDIGRWGVFMEPNFLTLGFANVVGRGVKFSAYNLDSTKNDIMVVRQDGNVGIGTNAPTAMLSVNGTANKPGGGTWDVFSDVRLKDVHGSFNRGLDDLTKLSPITFNYKEGNDLELPSDTTYVGVSAQEVQVAIPEAVSENENGYLELHTDPIIWTMLNSIKELKAENDSLRARVEALESR